MFNFTLLQPCFIKVDTSIKKVTGLVSCVFRASNMEVSTSKELLERWMDPVNGNTHFTKWRKKRKSLAIKLCGLKQRRNNTERNSILTNLARCELPLDADKVLAKLKELGVTFGTGTSKKQLAYILFCHLDPELTPPAPPTAVLTVPDPDREDLALKVAAVLKTHTFGEHCVPNAYRFDPRL